MIRVYFDGNVFNQISQSSYTTLLEKLNYYAHSIQIPYSPTHTREIVRQTHQYSSKELDILDLMTQQHCIEWKENQVQAIFQSIRTSLEEISSTTQYYDLNTLQTLLKSTLHQSVSSTSPPIGNWEIQEINVLDNLHQFLENIQPKMTWQEYIESVFRSNGYRHSIYEHYLFSYLLVDFIGYRSEKPTKDVEYLLHDAEHSFYGAHCDYFITNKERVGVKSKILYQKFHISTEVLQVDEFINSMDAIPYQPPHDLNGAIHEAYSFVQQGSAVSFYPKSQEQETEAYLIKLPIFHFNFFNYMLYQKYEKENLLKFTFKRIFENYSKFIFDSEIIALIDDLHRVFGENTGEKNKQDLKNNFISSNQEEASIVWNLRVLTIVLEKNESPGKVTLTYYVQ